MYASRAAAIWTRIRAFEAATGVEVIVDCVEPLRAVGDLEKHPLIRVINHVDFFERETLSGWSRVHF